MKLKTVNFEFESFLMLHKWKHVKWTKNTIKIMFNLLMILLTRHNRKEIIYLA